MSGGAKGERNRGWCNQVFPDDQKTLQVYKAGSRSVCDGKRFVLLLLLHIDREFQREREREKSKFKEKESKLLKLEMTELEKVHLGMLFEELSHLRTFVQNFFHKRRVAHKSLNSS